MRRWHEDVVLVEEEMRRTIEYGYWQAEEWLVLSTARAGTVEEQLQEGLTAYAKEQAHREAMTGEMLRGNWAGIRGMGRAYLARETAPSNEVVTTEIREEVEGREEDEEDDAEDEVPEEEDEEDEMLE